MKRALLIMAAMTTLAAPAIANEALAKSKNCLTCHSIDKSSVGPSFKTIASKYAGNSKAADALAVKVLKGSGEKTVFGSIPMPANKQVNEAEAKTLVTWILTLQ